MNDENLISAQEMIMTAFTNIERAQVEQNNKLLKSWKYTLQSIKSNALNGENLGMNLYSHSRVVDLKNEILLVECDHPGWIQTLRLYQKYILTGLKRGVPEVKISALSFRLRGSKAELHTENSESEIRTEIQKRVEKEEEVLKKFENQNMAENSESLSGVTAVATQPAQSSETKQIPENLQKILDRLKNDMLEDGKVKNRR